MAIVFQHGKYTPEHDGDVVSIGDTAVYLFSRKRGRIYLRIKNVGANTVYIRLLGGATTDDMPLAVNEVLELYYFCGYISAVCAPGQTSEIARISY
jgi:hypothetical protein